MNRFAWVLIGVLASSAVVRGAQYEIPLPELKGIYSNGNIVPSFGPLTHFNLPVTFDHIDSVYLDVTGNIAPARYRTQAIDGAPASEFNEYPALTFSLGWLLVPDDSSPWTALFNAHLVLSKTGPFHTRETFLNFSAEPPDWSFLQLGHPIAEFYIQPKLNSPEDNIELLIPAIAAITDARLIIEGTAVPEPTAALVILPGVLLLSRRPRQQD